ncbi:MAG TPA: hypothetical protein HA257_03835 [Candidatus Methanoperedenaceae archaeon]|nr:hypothetical protein [Candidatus Methanoperedenaceae archaeon]
MERTTIAISKVLYSSFREFAEKKHGMIHGAVKTEAENALRKHIKEGCG